MRIACASLALTACASHAAATHDTSYRVVRNGNETDYILQDRLLFPVDSAHISARAYDVVADVAADAKLHRLATIEVDGHTDTTGTREYNQRLSEIRAEAVADVLHRHGIEARRIRIRGFGETRLAVETGDDVESASNRRVVIRIIAAR